MPVPQFDSVFYVKDVPEIHYEDGLFHISYRAGKCRFQFVLSPHTALKARLLAAEATAKFQHAHTPTGNVRHIRRK